jgi:hypothetical protein
LGSFDQEATSMAKRENRRTQIGQNVCIDVVVPQEHRS